MNKILVTGSKSLNQTMDPALGRFAIHFLLLYVTARSRSRYFAQEALKLEARAGFKPALRALQALP
jgi:hypothetical protein